MLSLFKYLGSRDKKDPPVILSSHRVGRDRIYFLLKYVARGPVKASMHDSPGVNGQPPECRRSRKIGQESANFVPKGIFI